MRNLQKQVKKELCYQKLFWTFTVWINCSSDLNNFANSWPSASNFNSFPLSLEHFFLTVFNLLKKIVLWKCLCILHLESSFQKHLRPLCFPCSFEHALNTKGYWLELALWPYNPNNDVICGRLLQKLDCLSRI